MDNFEYHVPLSHYYNHLLQDDIHHKQGNDLSAVHCGKSSFAGTRFDTRGIVQLGSSISFEKTGTEYPLKVSSIPVHQKATVLHFLQSASWHEATGTVIGQYKIHYTAGHTAIIPIVYGVHLSDWWVLPGDSVPTAASVAWSGDNMRTRSLGYSVKLFKMSWTNPFPEFEIDEIDFVSCATESAPFLLAVTLE